MKPEDALLTIAELAVTIAAFTGLVSAFRGASRKWTSDDTYRLRFLVLLSFSIIVGSILPFAISGWTQQASLIWGITSIVYGLAVVGVVGHSFYRMIYGRVALAFKGFTYTSVSLGLLIHLTILVGGSNIVFSASPQLVVLGMLWCLVHCATVFLAMLTFLWSSDSE